MHCTQGPSPALFYFWGACKCLFANLSQPLNNISFPKIVGEPGGEDKLRKHFPDIVFSLTVPLLAQIFVVQTLAVIGKQFAGWDSIICELPVDVVF